MLEARLTIDPRALKPMNDIWGLFPEAGGVRVRPSESDPMLRFDIGPLRNGAACYLGAADGGRLEPGGIGGCVGWDDCGGGGVAWRAFWRELMLAGGGDNLRDVRGAIVGAVSL